jgi:hypothetical protein
MSPENIPKAPILLSTASFALYGAVLNPSIAMDAIKNLNVPIDGVDLYILCDEQGEIPPFPVQFMNWLTSYAFITLHTSLAGFMRQTCIDLVKVKKALQRLAKLFRQLDAKELVIHADCLEQNSFRIIEIIREELLETSVSFEMMGKNKSFGNQRGHLDFILRDHSGPGIVLDLAHLDEMRHSSSPKATIQHPAFHNKIRLVHGSLSGQRVSSAVQMDWYGRNDVDHVPCVLGETRHVEELALLTKEFPLVLEGAVPPEASGLQMLKSEIHWWKTIRFK